MKKILLIAIVMCCTLYGVAATYTVTSTANGTTADGVSLRWAITQANGSSGNVIHFNIGGTAPHTITLTSALPTITADNIIIDGSTQPLNGGGGDPKIIIDGGHIVVVGINLSGTKQGLEIYGIHLTGFTGYGIDVGACANNLIQIGNVTAGKRVVINDCGSVASSAAINMTEGTIKNTYIGVDSTGTIAVANTGYGINANGPCSGNIVIGGTASGEGNIISNNSNDGFYVGGTDAIIIQRNIFGSDKTGTLNFGNGGNGIYLDNQSDNTKVIDNLISANHKNGIFNEGGDSDTIRGNYIGTNGAGTADLGNTLSGIYITNTAGDPIIGGNVSGQGNIISGNDLHGIYINSGVNMSAGYIKGNKIGCDISGTSNVGNSGCGIFITQGLGRAIPVGGTASGESNIIAYNDSAGVRLGTATNYAVNIVRNSIFCNAGNNTQKGIELLSGSNHGITAPVVVTANSTSASGTAPANSTVEIFLDNDGCPGCQGKTYVTTVTANGAGNWSATGSFFGNVTATATINGDGTSEFSSCYTLPLSCECDVNMSFERAAGGCFGASCACSCLPDAYSTEIWSSCGSWGCGSPDINPGGTVSMTGTVATDGNNFLSMECGAGGQGEGLSLTLCPQTVIKAGVQYCFSIDLITRASFGGSAGTSSLIIYGSNSTCNNLDTLWESPALSGVWTGYNFCFTPDSDYNVISFRVINPSDGFSAVGLDNWKSTDGNFPPNLNPTANAGADTSVCNGSSVMLNGSGGPTYTWVPSATLINPTSATPTASPITDIDYILTVTNGYGCTATDTVSVTVKPLPAPSITGSLNFCNSDSTTLDAGGGYTSYLWSTGDTTQTVTIDTSGDYTVTVTGVNGCTNSDTVSVTEYSSVQPVITGSSSFCSGGSTLIDAGGGYTTYQWSTTDTTQTITVNTAGTYWVIVTDGNGCTGTDSIIITQNSSLTPSITGTLSFCNGDSTVLDAGPGFTSYLWSTNATTQIINIDTSGQFIVVVSDINGCTGTDTVDVVVNPLPTPTITGATSFCNGDFTVLDGGGPYTGYSWSTGATTQTITVDSTGNFVLTVTDTNGCTGTDSVNTSEYATVTPSITGALSFCSGDSTLLDAGPYSSYLWSTGQTTQTIYATSPGSYSVTVTATNGCTGSTSVNTSNYPAISPTITGDSIFCADQIATLTADSGYVYLWSTNATTRSITASAGGTYSVIVTDTNGCTGEDSITVVMNALPNFSILGNLSFCTGDSTILSSNNVFPTYSWSNGEINQSITVKDSGTYSITVTDNNGCTNSDTVSVMKNKLPDPAITGLLTFCSGGSTVLSADSGYVSYSWSTGATTRSVTANDSIYYVVTVINTNGCKGSDSVKVTINNNLTPTITGAAAFCSGKTDTLDAGPFYTTYSWSTTATTRTIIVNDSGTYVVVVSDANGCTGSDTITVAKNISPTPSITSPSDSLCSGKTLTLTTGTYSGYVWSPANSTTQSITVSSGGTYTLTVTDGNGCTGQSSKTITLNQSPTPPLQNTSGCTATPVVLDAGFYNTFAWSTGATTQQITVITTGSYTVTVTDANGCSGTATSVVTINPTPDATIQGPREFCFGNSTVLITGQASNYLWSTGETTQAINPDTAGLYQVLVANGNCFDTSSALIKVNPLPEVTGIPDTIVCAGATVQLIASGASSYVWNPSYGLDDSLSATPVATVGITTTYTVAGTDSNGCRSSDTLIVSTAKPCGLELPNGFSPNNDGKNDGYKIYGVAGFPNNTFIVFNRWGNEVYRKENYKDDDWNGVNNDNKPLPDGTYYVILITRAPDNKLNTYVDLRR